MGIAEDASGYVRPAAVAGAFYPADEGELRHMIAAQLDYARSLLDFWEDGDGGAALPQGAPKAVIVPHAGYVYSGSTAALAYALLERGRGMVRRAVIVGPTHRVAVRGVAASSAGAFVTPLGEVPVDIEAERRAMGLAEEQPLSSGMVAAAGAPAPAMIVNDPTHAREHAVEVQIPFLQTMLGPHLEIVPLNAGDAKPAEVGDVLRALWGGPETVMIISSDLSHYHPHEVARMLDDETIADILALRTPISPRRACGAYPVNGLLDVIARGISVGGYAETYACDSHRGGADRGDSQPPVDGFDLRLLGRSTSGDDGVVALAGRPRPAMRHPDEPVVGYASFALWQEA